MGPVVTLLLAVAAAFSGAALLLLLGIWLAVRAIRWALETIGEGMHGER